MTRDIGKIKVRWVQAGIVAPEFEARTLDDQPFKLSELKGKVLLLDFWATWCAPCVAELPNVKAAYEKYKADGFEVVGVSFDKHAETAKKFVASKQLAWTQVWAEKADDGPIANLYGVGGIPATFLIGPDGKVIERDLRGDALTKAIDTAMKRLKESASEKKTAAAGDGVDKQ
jgi:peroxiredoxin